jgi:hypothetical protein
LFFALLFVVTCGHSPRFVPVFPHEIPGACKFHCNLQRAHLILQANFRLEGSRTRVPQIAQNHSAPALVLNKRARASGGARQARKAFWQNDFEFL